MSRRLFAMGNPKYSNNFIPTEHPEDLLEPYNWRKPSIVFVCSMSDLFNEKISFNFIDKVFDVIKDTPQHTYQILTKRAKRMAEYFETREVPCNAWLGVTVECRQTIKRIDSLRGIEGATVRFLSCEPLLEDLGDMDLTGIHWMIVGGESGPLARPMQEEWVVSLRQMAKRHHVSFFFKQWGTWGEDGVKRSKHANGKKLKGKVVQQMPEMPDPNGGT
jgi:protein gp37